MPGIIPVPIKYDYHVPKMIFINIAIIYAKQRTKCPIIFIP